jgi:DMSO/TMAO reductase YedYZ molybdopterin-dependent catalytic subunit
MLARMLAVGALALMVGMLGCGGGGGNAHTSTTAALKPVVVPTLPAKIPGQNELDPATGLHVTGTPVAIDLAGYRLKVSGRVYRELSLSYDELRRLPKVTATPTLVCSEAMFVVFADTATWSGVPLKTILDMAGLVPGAKQITMKAADGYSDILTLDKALESENFLAYEWMGQPLPVLHGFPLRAIVPHQNGFHWVKWLLEIVVE